MYVTEQPAFLNAAVLGRTDLPPLQLLYHCKQIEKQAGVGVCDFFVCATVTSAGWSACAQLLRPAGKVK